MLAFYDNYYTQTYYFGEQQIRVASKILTGYKLYHKLYKYETLYFIIEKKNVSFQLSMPTCMSQCYLMSHYASLMPHYATLCNIMPHYDIIIPQYATLCLIMQHYVTLCNTMSH